jgi:hypothetical protein
VKDLNILVVLFLLHLHRFEFSAVIRGGESSWVILFRSLFPDLVPLGSLDPIWLSGLYAVFGASN